MIDSTTNHIFGYLHLAETARQDAFDLLRQHAREGGAYAIVDMRYDANEITEWGAEAPAYGRRRVGRADQAPLFP